MEPRVLVLGVGNILMRDEGLGVRALEALQAADLVPSSVVALDGGVLGLDLLPYLAGIESLMLIDAIDAGAAPGTILRLEGEEIPRALSIKVSLHQVGLQELLALASWQGSLPKRVVLWGMQPAVIEPGTELSSVAQDGLRELVCSVSKELTEWDLQRARQMTSATGERTVG